MNKYNIFADSLYFEIKIRRQGPKTAGYRRKPAAISNRVYSDEHNSIFEIIVQRYTLNWCVQNKWTLPFIAPHIFTKHVGTKPSALSWHHSQTLRFFPREVKNIKHDRYLPQEVKYPRENYPHARETWWLAQQLKSIIRRQRAQYNLQQFNVNYLQPILANYFPSEYKLYMP